MDKEQRVIWAECDDENKPVKTTYMPGRGDVPDDDKQLLPWRENEDLSLNGTNGIVIRCLPGPRAPRKVGLHVIPKMVVSPQDNKVPFGSVVEFTCR